MFSEICAEMLRSSKDKSSYDNGHIDVVVKDVKPGEVGSGSDTRFLLILFISLVIDLLAFTVILPLFPAILEHYGHKDGEVTIFYFFWLIFWYTLLLKVHDINCQVIQVHLVLTFYPKYRSTSHNCTAYQIEYLHNHIIPHFSAEVLIHWTFQGSWYQFSSWSFEPIKFIWFSHLIKSKIFHESINIT